MKIRLFTLGRADISISIGALMVVIAAVLMGRADDLALSMAALSLHEGAHTLAAMAAGKRVGEIELTSVGLCATIAGKRPILGITRLKTETERQRLRFTTQMFKMGFR